MGRPSRPESEKACSVEGCSRFAPSNGLCDLHRHRLKRTGSVGSSSPDIKRKTKNLTTEVWFWMNVEKTENCWWWRGYIDPRGYGRFKIGKKQLRAHQVSYRYVVGEFDKDLELDHLCRNKSCVNPNHLEPVSHRENVLRGEGLTAVYARRNHCKHGHLFEGDNLKIRYRGGQAERICLICRKNRKKIYGKL